MKTFTFQDDKSQKFWAVEQQDNELHLNWGKIGTQGQRQVKTFDDASAAQKAEQKLIAEKMKKGYQESQTASTPDNEKATVAAETAGIKPAPPAPAIATTAAPVQASCPWPVENSSIVLPREVAYETLSHRNWPGDPVLLIDKPVLLNQIATRVRERYQQITLFDSSACSLEWQHYIAQALDLPDSSVDTTLPPPVLAVFITLEVRFYHKDVLELQDQIVQQGGLEYATDVLIAMQSLQFEWDYANRQIIFHHGDNYSQDLPAITPMEIRLRKHLSLAEKALWQRCADKLIAALETMPASRQPLIALLLPEKPELAQKIAGQHSTSKGPATLEWLKLTANDATTLEAVEKYQSLRLFDDYYRGQIYCATVLKEQGTAAIARFTPYASGDYCGDVLTHINHPQAVMQLIRAAEQSKRCHERMTKASARFPHASMAALAELLAQKEEKRWRIMLMTQLSSHPELAAQISPWLSPAAIAQLEACHQLLSQPTDCASADMLPPVLVTPPWAVKKKKTAIPLLDLPLLPVPPVCTLTEQAGKELRDRHRWYARQIELGQHEGPQQFLPRLGFNTWKNGNIESVSKTTLNAWEQEDYPALINEMKISCAPYQTEWHLYMLTAVAEDKAIRAWNALSKEPHSGVAWVMTSLKLAGLTGLINSFSRNPQDAFPVALYFGAAELTPLVSRAFNRLKTQRELAREWLLTFPEHAIAGLLPAAFGKAGEAQDDARTALRLLIDNGHQPLIEQMATRYAQPDVVQAINAFLTLDPLDNYPTKIPALPGFWQPALWQRPLLANGLALPDDALNTLGIMLRFPTEMGLYPGLQQVKEICTPASLAAFAWDLFNAWQIAGAPAKESWAFTALGLFGDDDTARTLTPFIRTWPGESQHKRATVGLDILAAIGSDIALMQLNGIAQKLKFKALQERAREKIQQIAESRELTVAELEDRLAPDLGLDESGTLTLDFGPRRFTVSFDEALKPFVRDENRNRLKDLPKPNKSDDPALAAEAVSLYKALKKDARTIASQQIRRLESAMCERRRWSAQNFRLFLVEHPLICHLTRRLVWGIYDAENTLLACFRVAEDNSYSTANDDLFILPEGDIRIGLPHVLEIPMQDAAAFGQLLADYELLPPFRQLDRPHYSLTAEESNATELTRWTGRSCPSGRVAGLANKGWLRGMPLDAGWIGWMLKPLGAWTLVLEIDEGFAVGSSPDDLSAEQKLSSIWLWQGKAQDYGWGSLQDQQKQPFSVLDKVTVSEVINDIDMLFN
ncbi:MolR family transcriptional regulator [Klebsiella sp. RIT-PI-d]|uniref:WGR and DUF4132 domain-containing protein n=1 Tax=Klebsiella sp. RIT-PI-d TaxID=1681196 RepID=UPI000676708B|nr:WGR and DUF4132 domain-containing protein [Klebsiella sp. RIT-PI-d]KNC09922.1 MolR family transcriptional regulator [Klebsiella sp. RIT-PI-d]